MCAVSYEGGSEFKDAQAAGSFLNARAQGCRQANAAVAFVVV
jgi:hypothetical protein